MKSLDTRSSDPIAFEAELRQQLLDRIWFGILLIVVVGVPASISRALSTGWLHLYTFHILMGILVFVMYFSRRLFTYRTRSVTLLTMFFLVGTTGVLTLGLLGAGLWWLVMCSFMAGTLLSHKIGLTVSVVSLGVVALAGYLFTSGVITYPVDANHYVVDPTSWISFLMAVSILPFMVFQSISIFQRSTLDLLTEVNKQKTEIERMATHDQLTGMPLLNLAKDRLQIAISSAARSGKKVSLMFIDLDGFKAVNDTYGHEAGDHVLKEVSSRILQILRDEDTAARIGGDEFILILAGVESEKDPAVVAGRIIEEVSRPILFSGNTLAVGASVGIALYPDHANDAESLRRLADEAMYVVKKSGKNRFAFAERKAGI